MYEYAVLKMIKIVDGDTVDVLIDLGFDIHRKERVRILVIDAPETKTTDENERKFGMEAKDYVVSWFSAHPVVKVKTTKDDKYGRILGDFFGTDHVNLSQSIIKDGFAWEYNGDKKNKDFISLVARRNLPQ